MTAATTGIGRYTHEITRRLLNTEHTFFLYSLAPLTWAHRSDNATLRCARAHAPLLHAAHAQLLFPHWARRDRIDVFWSPRHHLPLLMRRPSVVTIHDMVWRRSGETMIPLGRLIERLLMPRSLRHADRIIAVSAATAGDIVAFYPDVAPKITVIPEAATLQGVEPSTQPLRARPYMLFVGTLEPRKNLANVLHAYHMLLETGVTSHRLVVAGNPGWKNRDLMRRLHQAPFSSHVDLIGHVADDELVALYRGADFVVAPSLYEGFGLVVLDAMAFGTPVICANTSAVPEVAGDAACLVDPRNPAEIACAMQRLIEEPDLRDKLHSDGLVQAARFSWERAAEDTLTTILAAAGAATSMSGP